MSSLLRSVQIFPDLKGAHDPDLSYKKFDEVQHRTSIYVAAEDIPAGTEITDPRWVIKLDNSAAYDAEQDRKEAEALRVEADAARMGFVPKGAYNPANENKYGEWYTHEGGSYGYIYPTPSTGVPLTDTSHWQQIASVGGQDLVDAAVAARDAAQAQAALAQGYAAQLAAGLLRPKGTYANLAALNAGTPAAADPDEIYITLDDGKWCYHNGTAWVAGGVYQTLMGVDTTLGITGNAADAKVVGDRFLSNSKRLNPSPYPFKNYTSATSVVSACILGLWVKEKIEGATYLLTDLRYNQDIPNGPYTQIAVIRILTDNSEEDICGFRVTQREYIPKNNVEKLENDNVLVVIDWNMIPNGFGYNNTSLFASELSDNVFIKDNTNYLKAIQLNKDSAQELLINGLGKKTDFYPFDITSIDSISLSKYDATNYRSKREFISKLSKPIIGLWIKDSPIPGAKYFLRVFRYNQVDPDWGDVERTEFGVSYTLDNGVTEVGYYTKVIKLGSKYTPSNKIEYFDSPKMLICIDWSLIDDGYGKADIYQPEYKLSDVVFEKGNVFSLLGANNTETESLLADHVAAENPHNITPQKIGLTEASVVSSGLMSAADKQKLNNILSAQTVTINGSGLYKNASAYGFLPENTADENAAALQTCVSGGGTIVVDIPGVYSISKSIILDSYTTLIFGNNVFIAKSAGANGKHAKYQFMNRGLLDSTFNTDISIVGLRLITNGLGMGTDIGGILGQRGNLAFFCIKRLVIKDFEVLDASDTGNYNIHIQNFEDIKLENITVISEKDGVHLGKGNGFIIRHCHFLTNDDAIALNAHDYPTGTAMLGWIENGVIEDINLLDGNIGGLPAETSRGIYMLGGSWKDWESGNLYRTYGDAVVSNGKIYRTVGTIAENDTVLVSTVQPTHLSGTQTLADGHTWFAAQHDNICYNAGVRNVYIKNINVERKSAAAVSMNFDNDIFSRSVYPGSDMPVMENITIDNVHVRDASRLHQLITTVTPVNGIRILNSDGNVFGDGVVQLRGNVGIDYGVSNILMSGINFKFANDNSPYIANIKDGRAANIKVIGSLVLDSTNSPKVFGPNLTIDSDIDVIHET